jgi:hypothetical protein
MKIKCIICDVIHLAILIGPCPYCGEHVCDSCWPNHEDSCLAEDHDILNTDKSRENENNREVAVCHPGNAASQ